MYEYIVCPVKVVSCLSAVWLNTGILSKRWLPLPAEQTVIIRVPPDNYETITLLALLTEALCVGYSRRITWRTV